MDEPPLSLAAALGLRAGDVAAFVGGGGKSGALFLAAAELAAGGATVLSTTTTHIALAQTGLAPAHVRSRAELPAALARARHVLLTGEPEAGSGKVAGIAPEAVCALQGEFDCILVEADGARGRPFKAPAAHEPVVPPCTTVLVAVAGIDAIGLPLAKEYVHRPEAIARLHGGATVSVEMVAAVLAHPQGGLKNAPERARVVALINKVESEGERRLAMQLASRLLASGAFESVVFGALAARERRWTVLRRPAPP